MTPRRLYAALLGGVAGFIAVFLLDWWSYENGVSDGARENYGKGRAA